MDSNTNSYMEPEEDDFLPDGDDFVVETEKSDEDMFDKLVPHVIHSKTVW